MAIDANAMSVSVNPDIPLAVLVVDADDGTSEALCKEMDAHGEVQRTGRAASVADAQVELRSGDYNTVFVDPLSLGIGPTAEFVFAIRKALPEIVFVLYVDKTNVEAHRDEFYAGDRRRFVHYYTLDKQTPVGAFRDEVGAVLRLCQRDLSWRLSAESLRKLKALVAEGQRSAPDAVLSSDIASELDRAVSFVTSGPSASTPVRKQVFFSHRFAESEYVDGLTQLLQREGFDIVIGAPAYTFISQAILQRIGDADYFLCLMTRHKAKTDGTYTTSPWLLEEKGAALALRKPVVLLVEDGVDDFGGLQGDWQRIHFAPKGFLTAALQAVEQLKSYAGSS